MAPRPLETREQLIERLLRVGDRVVAAPLRFGGHHHTHAVVVESGVWRVRRLTLDRAKAAAYLAEHGMFMPEHAEELSEPGPDVVCEAGSLAGLIAGLQRLPWPLV